MSNFSPTVSERSYITICEDCGQALNEWPKAMREQHLYGHLHQRLKDAVVAAAKALVEVQNRSPYPDDGSTTLPLQLRFEAVVDALLKFERENNL